MAKKKVIMVVDDEETLVTLVSAILANEGYEVISASSGQECLDKLKKSRPDLIILDMMMPGMSGREVCEKIRKDKELKSTKIIFLTVAKFSEVGKETLKSMGVIDYINKPFENEDLIKRIKKALG